MASSRFAARLVVGATVAAWLAAAMGACGGQGSEGAPDAGVADGARDVSIPDASPDASRDAASDTSDDAASDASDGADASDAADAAPHDCTAVGTIVTWTRDKVRVDYDLSAGTATFSYDGAKKIAGFYAGVQLATYITTRAYTTRTCVVRGDEAIVTSTAPGMPTLEQSFVLNGGNKFLARVTVKGTGIATNWIAPVVMDDSGTFDLGSATDARALWVPYDNDAWVSYNALPIAGSGTSNEVAAFYDNASRSGVVVGSVTHDTWKSGVYYAGSGSTLKALNVFGGAVDKTWTHDVLPHGKVSGDAVASPVVFIGAGPDWRALLEEYAEANLAYQPALAWGGGVPFGWNSWGKMQSQISYDKAIVVSDFIKNNLQNAGFSNGNTVYVNLDSYWDNLSSAQLDQFVAHCKANGQKAGIYWAPFVDWGKSATRQVEGTTYTYADIWLKDANGKPIELDGAYAVDPTHPGTKGRIDTFIDQFKAHGFEYVKLDFLTHGALESSVRADPTVQTGVQAYQQGMRHIVDRIGGSMFISASIAPLFPHGYAHARRVACDTYGAATGSLSTQYEMNSASYGWWMSGRLYRFNDPDGMVFQGFTSNDNMTRLVSGVVSGTVFLNGDDLTAAPAQALARAYLTSGRMNDVARVGKAFRPVEGNTGTNPSEVLVMDEGAKHYVAVFNFGASAATKAIDVARLGLSGATDYAVTDLWSGATSTAHGTWSVAVEAGFARLFVLE